MNHESQTLLALPRFPTDQVPMALFRRHIGLPGCAELDSQLQSLFDQAKQWYQRHGEPWVEARQVAIERIVHDVVHLEDQLQLASPLLARGLARAEAHALVVVAVSAGKSVDQQIDVLWKADRVDEAIFLNAYAIAMVEHFRYQASDHLRQNFCNSNTIVLPHYSPGYDGWDLVDQAQLFRLICNNRCSDSVPLELLPSSGLKPSKSTLAVYGVTRRTDFAEDLQQYWNYQATPSSIVRAMGNYTFPEKALAKWRDSRLKVVAWPNNELLATFRLNGSTCTNMGVPLAFEYQIHLKREEFGGHRILSSSCEPAAEHMGYQNMCAYHDKPECYMAQLRSHQPLVGQPLSDALTWQSSSSPTDCLCTRASQDHKWQIVLQTLHFALEDHE